MKSDRVTEYSSYVFSYSVSHLSKYLNRSRELLAPVFNEVAGVNWDLHLPNMYRFWSSILLRTQSYHGQPWPKHAALPVGVEHFTRWLELFKGTVDEHFAGPKAVEAKNAAASIADTFQNRLQLVRPMIGKACQTPDPI